MASPKLLSIIVPVYNSEFYLHRCLDSLIRQLDNQTELILVDDGSTDNSYEICSQYARTDSRIVLIHQENGGESAARNTGIRFARGEWITFVDSDDYVKDDFGDTIRENLENGLDVILFEYEVADEDSKYVGNNSRKSYYFTSIDHDLFLRCNFLARDVIKQGKFNMRSAWAKCYRTSMLRINAITFPEGVKIGEDMLFTLQVYSTFQSAKCVMYPIYCYFFCQKSSITNRYKPDYEEIVSQYVNAIKPWLSLHQEYEEYHMYYRLNDVVLYCKYDFFHKSNLESESDKRERFKRIFVDGQYRKYYKQAQKAGLLRYLPMTKRRMIWLSLHNYYSIVKYISLLRYRVHRK